MTTPQPSHPLEATELRSGMYAVRPAGHLGTCGFSPAPWQVFYTRAQSADEAVKRATQKNSVFGNSVR